MTATKRLDAAAPNRAFMLDSLFVIMSIREHSLQNRFNEPEHFLVFCVFQEDRPTHLIYDQNRLIFAAFLEMDFLN